MNPMPIFSNDWFAWFFATYSQAMLYAPMVAIFILKCIAVLDKKNPQNTINGWIDLISHAAPEQQQGLKVRTPMPPKHVA